MPVELSATAATTQTATETHSPSRLHRFINHAYVRALRQWLWSIALGLAPITYMFILVNFALFQLDLPQTRTLFGLNAAVIKRGEWFRFLTFGFFHSSEEHIVFNMLHLCLLSRLEQYVGPARYIGVYIPSLLTSSVGALIWAWKVGRLANYCIGASGAVYGICGALCILGLRKLDIVSHLILQELVWRIKHEYLAEVGRASKGAHIGGLVGGVLCGLVITAAEAGMFRRPRHAQAVLIGAVAFAGVVCSVALAHWL